MWLTCRLFPTIRMQQFVLWSSDQPHDLPERQPSRRSEDKGHTCEAERDTPVQVRLVSWSQFLCLSSVWPWSPVVCCPLQEAGPLHAAADPSVWRSLRGVRSVPRTCWRWASTLLGISVRLLPGNRPFIPSANRYLYLSLVLWRVLSAEMFVIKSHKVMKLTCCCRVLLLLCCTAF